MAEEENLAEQFQFYQQQLQNVMRQKEIMNLQNGEIDRALEELKSLKEKNAYKIIGNIMVSKPAEELRKELEEVKENIELNIKSLEKSEERVGAKLKELQGKLKLAGE